MSCLSVAAIRSEEAAGVSGDPSAQHQRLAGARCQSGSSTRRQQPGRRARPLLKSNDSSGGGIGMTLELIDGTINLHDVAANKRASIEQCQTLLRFVPRVHPVEWSLVGNVVSDGKIRFRSFIGPVAAARAW